MPSSPATLAVSAKELDLRFRALMASFEQRQSQSGISEEEPKARSLDGGAIKPTPQLTGAGAPTAKARSASGVSAALALPATTLAGRHEEPRQGAPVAADDGNDVIQMPVVEMPRPRSTQRHSIHSDSDQTSPADRVAMLPRASATANMRGLLARSGLLDSPVAATPSPQPPRYIPGKAKVSLAELARTPEAGAGSPTGYASHRMISSASSTPLSVLAEENARREEEVRYFFSF